MCVIQNGSILERKIFFQPKHRFQQNSLEMHAQPAPSFLGREAQGQNSQKDFFMDPKTLSGLLTVSQSLQARSTSKERKQFHCLREMPG